jgi:hypothetical protein
MLLLSILVVLITDTLYSFVGLAIIDKDHDCVELACGKSFTQGACVMTKFIMMRNASRMLN